MSANACEPIPCDACGDPWCEACGTHWFLCGCPGEGKEGDVVECVAEPLCCAEPSPRIDSSSCSVDCAACGATLRA